MIEVIKSGFFTAVQDLGRWGYQEYGVGIAGAMDSFALSAANLLAGNPEREAGLEITLIGPVLKFHRETAFAVTGADLDPRLDGRPIPNWTSRLAPSGSVLSFGGLRAGARAYLALGGGIDVPPVMGSRSTYLLGRFGGMEGRPLKPGDRLPLGSPPAAGSVLTGTLFPENLRPLYRKNPTLRVIGGPFEDFFSDEGIRLFFSEEYTISPQSDRMGYRLQGKEIGRRKTRELITCGLANGTVQVPPNGQPIVLLADRQTIGGYPIIATLISADLPLIGQCAAGDKVRFSRIPLDEAREAYVNLWQGLKEFFNDQPSAFSGQLRPDE